MGIFILLMLVGIEIGLVILGFKTRSRQSQWKNKLRVGAFVVIFLLAIVQVIQLGFQWYLLFVVLFIEGLIALIHLMKQRRKGLAPEEKPFKPVSAVLTCVRRTVFLVFLLIPSILFPQYKSLPVTGDFKVATVSYTLEDSTRTETYIDGNTKRKVTIEFWYPEVQDANQEFPLVVFSHGSFGYRGSNYSTYMELASNGYIVCSIDHTYHSFFTKQTDGKVAIVDQKFINDAIAVQNGDYDDATSYELTQEWLDIRIKDMGFVLDTLLEKAEEPNVDAVFAMIDKEHIGVFGHSIGGATSAQIGRIRDDIDAVIVVDGTMLGEVIGFENGKEILTDVPYPVPILDIFNEEHYLEALENSEIYANMVISGNAVDLKQTVFMGSGHLNFTDLPLFSPTLANLLGTGEIDRRYCIEKINEVILSYFDHYLKGEEALEILNQY